MKSANIQNCSKLFKWEVCIVSFSTQGHRTISIFLKEILISALSKDSKLGKVGSYRWNSKVAKVAKIWCLYFNKQKIGATMHFPEGLEDSPFKILLNSCNLAQ